jgi:hypothetical protein
MISKYVLESAVVLGAFLIAALQFALNDSRQAIATLTIFLAAGSRIGPAIMRIQQGLIQIGVSIGSARPTLDLINELKTVERIPQTDDVLETKHHGFSSDIKVELDDKVISMSEFEFERLFNVSPKGNFYGVIPIKKKSKKLKITIADKLYDHELTVFEYDLTSIKKLPKLEKIHNPGNKSI